MIIKEVVAKLPSNTQLKVLFQDESCFGRISDRRRCWAPIHERPIVGQQVVREFVYAIAAVCPPSGHLTSLVMPWLDTEIMSIFLAHVSIEFKDAHCLMFLDAAGWHTAKQLRTPKNITLSFLPPYSPELNPVEHIWKQTILGTSLLILLMKWKMFFASLFIPSDKIINWFLRSVILTGSKLYI
jgi:hypothetical protein